MRNASTRAPRVSDEPLDLDRHRGMAAQKATDIRRILAEVCEGIIYFDAQISDRAFDLCMSEQKLDGPEIASPPVDQGSFCASQ
jgi:hypothetical protein